MKEFGVMWKKVAILLVFIVAMVVQPSESSAKAKEIYVFMDGKQVLFTNPPVVTKGTTQIEFRPVFEALGMTVQWNAKNKKIIGTKKGLKIEMTLNNRTALLNGKRVQMPMAPSIKNGRTLVPLRFVGEASGKKVAWNGNVQMIIINDGQPFEKINRKAPDNLVDIWYEAYAGKIGGLYLDLDKETTMAEFVNRFGFPDKRYDKSYGAGDSSYLAYGDLVFYTDLYEDYYPPQTERFVDGPTEVFFSEDIKIRDIVYAFGEPPIVESSYDDFIEYRVGDFRLIFYIEGFYYDSRVRSYQLFSAISG